MKVNILKSYKDTMHRIKGYRERKEGNMFDSFYYEHLDFMEKSMDYMIEGETLLHVETEEKCPHCASKLSYRIFKIEKYVEKYSYFGDVNLKVALCCSCAEEISIPSLEEYNKNIIVPLGELQSEERCSLLSLRPDPKPTSPDAEFIISEPEVEEEEVSKSEERLPSNANIFEDVIKPTVIELEYLDTKAIAIKEECKYLYNTIRKNPGYVKYYSKFPNYMIDEMISINAEIVLHLKQGNLDITLLGLEYAKTHVYSERVKLIISAIKSIPNYILKMEKIYGEDWENKFNKDWSCPKRLDTLEVI